MLIHIFRIYGCCCTYNEPAIIHMHGNVNSTLCGISCQASICAPACKLCGSRSNVHVTLGYA